MSKVTYSNTKDDRGFWTAYINDSGSKKKVKARTQIQLKNKLLESGFVKSFNAEEQTTMKDVFAMYDLHSKATHTKEWQTSVQGFVRHLQSLTIHNRPLEQILVVDLNEQLLQVVRKTIDDVKGNLSNRTRNHIYGQFLGCIKFIYNKSREYRSIFQFEPDRLGKETKLQQFHQEAWCPTQEQVEKLLQELESNFHPKYHCFTLLCANGLRAGEAVSLKVSDIDFPRKKIKVQRAMSNNRTLRGTKTVSGMREVYFGKKLKEVLEVLIANKESNDWIFDAKFNDGKPIGYNSLMKYGIRKALKNLNMQHEWKKGVHPLRHYYASRIIQVQRENNRSPLWVQKMLGHSSYQITTQLYGHLIDKDPENMNDIIEESLY
ncbi:MAG: putative integrase [Prokaryotic dsDNA virus sp.]|nr:MAG: putative integrase [Prokaryotic dsDNA virus sp.]|tara:strand:+ start:9234 stop:10361 length:1128 start_codon:yes stop_codon:yes gene_type:complete